MKQIKSILLIDDSKPINFYNQKIINTSKEVNSVSIAENGLDALDFLKKNQFPNIIFLDINMPKMNGFEFLDKYSDINPKLRKNTIIVILSTTNMEKDKIRAEQTGLVYDFIEKPLSREDLRRINTYYKEAYL